MNEERISVTSRLIFTLEDDLANSIQSEKISKELIDNFGLLNKKFLELADYFYRWRFTRRQQD